VLPAPRLVLLLWLLRRSLLLLNLWLMLLLRRLLHTRLNLLLFL
jgi:hypothetical protein